MIESQKKPSVLKKFAIEVAEAIPNAIFGNSLNKIGLSVIGLVLSGVLILSPMADDTQKPIGFYIAGVLLVIVSLGLLFKRYSELKEETENPE